MEYYEIFEIIKYYWNIMKNYEMVYETKKIFVVYKMLQLY